MAQQFSVDALNSRLLTVRNTFLELVSDTDVLEKRMIRCASEPAIATAMEWPVLALEQPQAREPENARACYDAVEHVAKPASSSERQSGKRAHGGAASRGKPARGKPARSETKKTTVVMTNLPYQLTRAMLLEMLDKAGLHGLYNFVYFPRDFLSRQGLGYAFVNLVGQQAAQTLFHTFQGYSDWPLTSLKVCEVEWSRKLQGLQANVRRFRDSSVMHPSVAEEFKPMLFDRGVQVAFPAPTRALEKPRRP